MRMKTIVATVLLTGAMTVSSLAQLYVAGDFNGWAPDGSLMTESSSGSGIWQLSVTGLAPSSRQEFKITDGAWDGTEFPGANSWLYADAAGNVSITYDLNSSADGWSPASQRIELNVDPGTWTAVGDWQGWVNNDATTAMTPLGGGIYEYQQVIAPGSYSYKAVVTGSWDAIGPDARSINAGNLSFTTTASDSLAVFKVDALNGTIQVSVVPEPASLALFGLSGLAALVVLRRRK